MKLQGIAKSAYAPYSPQRWIAVAVILTILTLQTGYGFHLHQASPSDHDDCVYCHWITSSNAVVPIAPTVGSCPEIISDSLPIYDQAPAPVVFSPTSGRSPPSLA